MSSQAIEARSLSSLTTLAFNPPSYPRNPTHVKHEPLVLYIARVPGSRDVFLSPMKPRDKVVTAEDIQSSLYYVHVEQPEDTHLVTPPPEPGYAEHQPVSPNHPPIPQIQRRAVPTAPDPPSMPFAPKRKPVPGTLAPVNDFDNRQNANAANYSQTSSRMLGRDYDPRRSVDSIQYRGENDKPSLPPRRPSEQPYSAGTSLTLIRRDPGSSAQWNVACIEDPPVLDVSSSTLYDPGPKKKTGAPMYLEIANPGYSKFLNNSEIGSMPSLNSHSNDLAVRSHNPNTGAQPAVGEAPRGVQADRGESVFRRRLWLEGSKYTNAGFGHRKINSHDSSIGRQSPRDSFESWQRERSSADLRPPEAPPFVARDDQAYSTIQMSDRQWSFRGYVFMSPWNGRCEFVTGAGGDSLKCRHLVPGLQGALPMAMPVSELRFNLPTSSKASTPRGEESSKRSSFFHRPRHNRHGSATSEVRSDRTEEVRSSLDRLSLSLGQELAGGGFGGKQAKLGKLIIEDEGLKMVDLLVAANIALWWRAYEKVEGRSRSDRGSF